MKTYLLSLLSTSLLAASATVAHADPAATVESTARATAEPAAVQSAIEIGVSGGYTRSLGKIDGGMDSIDELTGAGGHLELQVGYRFDPHLAIGGYASVARYSNGIATRGSDHELGAFTTGIKADWHFRPDRARDPWISLATGVRWTAIEEGGANQRHLFALDLARVQLGVDYRLTPSVAIAPMIGMTASTFTSEDGPMTEGWDAIDDHKISVSFQAGVMGRFDLFARH